MVHIYDELAWLLPYPILPGELLKLPGLPLQMKMRKSLNKESGNLGSNPKWHPSIFDK